MEQYLKYDIVEDGKSKRMFHPVQNLTMADKFVAFLDDNSSEKKRYENFQVMDETKTKVLKDYDKEQLLIDKKLRQIHQRQIRNDRNKGNRIV